MFETKKQLKEEIKRLNREIEGLKISKDITIKVAESETRNAKAVANYWKDKFKNSPTAINKHNEFLIKHITSDNSRLDEKNKNLKKENEKLREQLTCIGILDTIQENCELRTKLIKSTYEKNTEIRKLIDKNTELQSNIVALTATIQNLKKLILE